MSKPAQVLPSLEIVAAVAENGVIGRALALPWHQRADLGHFKALTIGRPIVMGRRTHQSIGRALPGRRNLVVTRDAACVTPGAESVPSLAAALAAAAGAPALMVIGGAALYAAALPLASRLHLTEIHASPDGDVQFPAWDRSAWTETARERHEPDAENDFPYSFVTLTRR